MAGLFPTVLVALLILAATPPGGAPTNVPTSLDWPVAGGHFYAQANGRGGAGGSGFSVVDDAAASFWSEFQRLGGVDALGFPVSRRFAWDGFVVQAFQKAVLQWRPETGHADFLNVFDRLSQAGKDGWLDVVRSTPPSFDNAPDAALAWPEVVRRHLALLDVNLAIKTRYFADADPVQHYGLPMAYKDYGNVFVVRAQRAVLQQWATAVPWAAAGQVVVANGGDNAKEAGVYPAEAMQPEPPSVATGDERFGLIGTSEQTDAFTRLGASWWYSWGTPTPGSPLHRVGQISLRPDHVTVSRVPASVLQDGARHAPGGYWLIGNEPNVPGQDAMSPEDYADELAYYVTTIKAVDPTAKIVAPNVLNFDATCSGCTGLTSGHAWIDRFRAAWASSFGGEPPIDVWGVHAYTITWDRLPMTDAATVQKQVVALSDYLAAIPAQQQKPVWLTEFGVIWAYPGYTDVATGCAAPPQCVAPSGTYDQAAVATYLDSMLGWLTSNASRYRLGKWFVYSAYGQPEPYATVYGGISLLAGSTPGADLTPLGKLFQRYAGQ